MIMHLDLCKHGLLKWVGEYKSYAIAFLGFYDDLFYTITIYNYSKTAG